MTGTWEQRLTNFAEGGVPWDVPTRGSLVSGLNALRDVLNRVASDPGITGQAGSAAQAKFSGAASQIAQQITYIEDELAQRLDQANDIRSRARDALGTLPPGSLSGGQEAAVRGAATGATLLLGPISFLAGEGAVGLINGYLSDQREAAARSAMEGFSDEMDAVHVSDPPPLNFTFSETDPVEPYDGGNGGGSGGGGGRSGGRSFEKYPDWDVSPVNPNQGGGGGGGDYQGGTSQPEYHTLPDYVPSPQPDGPVYGHPPIIDLENISPDPTPDGPISGTPHMPGVIPSGPGGGSIGMPGGPSAGIGSGLGAGLIAGGGGAAALGRLARGAGVPGGSLFGGGPAGGTASSSAAGRSGGLLGKTPAGNSGLGARGVGGMGGAAAGGAPGSSSTARGAGMRAGGLSGAGGTGGTGGGAAGGGARGTGAGSRGVGGMGGPGSRSDRKDETARGLGGPIAPRMEDDEEIAPRSENAQAGGRDE